MKENKKTRCSLASEGYKAKPKRKFRSGFFSKPRKEATKELYPDSPMQLDKEVLGGKKFIILDLTTHPDFSHGE